jgi:OmpA-OmpF porin, OOP family
MTGSNLGRALRGRMKSIWLAAMALVALPLVVHAQPLQHPGFYVGAEGGLNWLLNTSFPPTVSTTSIGTSTVTTTAYLNTGRVVGGVIGYDFVGPRVELEGVYRDSQGTLNLAASLNFHGARRLTSASFGLDVHQASIMSNVYYDFLAGRTIVPYAGAGAGVAFLTVSAFDQFISSPQIAYQAIVGVGWNIDEHFRLNLEARYYGTNFTFHTTPADNNFAAMIGLQYKFGTPTALRHLRRRRWRRRRSRCSWTGTR